MVQFRSYPLFGKMFLLGIQQMSGTVELKTNRLLLRRHQREDALVLFEIFPFT